MTDTKFKKGLAPWNKGKHCSDETKLKLSIAHIGQQKGNTHRKGHHHSEETKMKISSWNKGRISPMKGKKHSEETRKKISESNRRLNRHMIHSQETRKKMSESHTGKPSNSPTKFSKGHTSWLKGKQHSEEMKKKLSEIAKRMGRKFPSRVGCKLSEKDRKKKSDTAKRLGIKPPVLIGEMSPHWQGGKSFEPYTTDWTETLKRSIRERDNYICQICSQYGNNVHHIDYVKEHCNPDNLITLCQSCHVKTNYNRDRWKDTLIKITVLRDTA